MTNQRTSEGFIASSLLRQCGVQTNLLRTPTGVFTCLCMQPRIIVLTTLSGCIICMPTCQASITGVAQEVSVSVLFLRQFLKVYTNHNNIRHPRSSPSLWRSRRSRPSRIRVPHVTFNLAWYLTSEGSRIAISLLPQTDRRCDEPPEQQQPVPDIRTQPIPGLLQSRIKCQLEHRRSIAVPLYKGEASW